MMKLKKKKYLVHIIAAARPNFMKVAPLLRALDQESWCRTQLIHTGQHYDSAMSDAFFEDLSIREPDHHLGVGSGSHAEQTAQVMLAYDRICNHLRPDWVIVVGDVNSTMACTLVAAKRLIKVAHLEAGLRSGDRTMPEEINRIVTDTLADLLWTPSEDGDEHLRREGISPDRVERVGNIMIDALEINREKILTRQAFERFDLTPRNYGVVTLHRPSNVDDPMTLRSLTDALSELTKEFELIFPVHPRTRKMLEHFDLMHSLSRSSKLRICEPLGYIDFMSLVVQSRVIITDSGGLQEEATYLGIPCLTLRPNTERPVTLQGGGNRLVEPEDLVPMVRGVFASIWRPAEPPQLWDGRAADRVVASLKRHLDLSEDIKGL